MCVRPPCCPTATKPYRRRSGFVNDLVRYDSSTLGWAAVAAQSPPSPRAYHGFAQSLGRLFVFGGQNRTGSDRRVYKGGQVIPSALC